MNVKKALKFYEGLSKDQQKFINEKQISTTLPLRDWIVFLKNTAAYDEIGDMARKNNTTKIVFSVVGIIASVLIMFWIPLIGIILIVIAVLVMAEAIRVNSKLVRLDLSNHLRIFLMPLLFVLKDKAGERAHVTLSLDLRNPKRIEPTKKYKELENDIKLYEPKYIIGKLKLLDDAILEFIVSDDIRSIRILKRSGGKTKIKHKSKVVRYYFIRLIFPKKNYAIRNGSAASSRVEDTPDAIVGKLKVKTKTTAIEEIISVEDFLKSIQELYTLVQLKPGIQLPQGVVPAKPAEPRPEGSGQTAVIDDGASMIPFMVWGGAYFTTGDYSGFSREQGFYSDDSGQDTFLDS